MIPSVGYAESAPGHAGLQPQRSDALSRFDGLVHGFTKRVPGAGKADGNISYTSPRDRHDAWAMRQQWCSEIGVDAFSLVVPHQVHGATVGIASGSDRGKGAAPGSALVGQVDALVTNEPGVPLMTTHADCLPVILYAPDDHVVATVHAGWRGTVTDIVGETVRTMTSAFRVDPDTIVAALGPSICSSCYEIGSDVATRWDRIDPWNSASAVRMTNGTLSFDLAASNAWLLQRAGVPERSIERSTFCTKCHGDHWFSHRGQGPVTGRFASIVALRESA